MICSNCGNNNPATNTFCGSCGEKLSRNCADCGSAVPPLNTFCGNCGSKFDDTIPSNAEAANPLPSDVKKMETMPIKPEFEYVSDEVLKLIRSYVNQNGYGQKNMKAAYPHIEFDYLLKDDQIQTLLKSPRNSPSVQPTHTPKNILQRHVISGHGDDGNSKIMTYLSALLISGAAIFVSHLIIQDMSEYHLTDMWTREFGLRIGEMIILANTASILVALGISSSVLTFIAGKLSPGFNSRITVYEDKVEGFSTKKEDFKLSYNEISSVSVSEKSTVDINVSGKVFTVWTKSCNIIAKEINKRRNV